MATPPPLPILSFGDGQVPSESDLPPFPTILLPHNVGSDARAKPGGPSAVSSTSSSASSNIDLAHVARSVLKAKRVAVVCGAGISTASGIPDFRSGAGLFKSLKEQHPDAKLTSGKDLFDVGLFSSEANAAIFYNMIAELKKQTDAVEPTAFHAWLKDLDDEGKLFRVYTQNIDCLEEKAGLTYGLGDKSLPLPPRRAGRSPSKARPSGTSTPTSIALQPSSLQASTASTSCPTPRSSASPPPSHSTIPRVIPLHGHLATLSCSACKLTTPVDPYLDLLASGSAPACPSCLSIDQARSAAGERSRGVGMLRPDVVLYGEEHKDGERVGEITQRDLMGQRPDLLLVVGTTLKVKGTKRLVRELAKVIKPPSKSASTTEQDDEPPLSSSEVPSSSQQSATSKRPRQKRPSPIHTLYLNYDFPTPSREWAGVFDCWLRGDIQQFVQAVKDEKARMKGEMEEKEQRKRKREEASSSPSKARVVSNGVGKEPDRPKGRTTMAAMRASLPMGSIQRLPASTYTLPVDIPRLFGLPPKAALPPLPVVAPHAPPPKPAAVASVSASSFLASPGAAVVRPFSAAPATVVSAPVPAIPASPASSAGSATVITVVPKPRPPIRPISRASSTSSLSSLSSTSSTTSRSAEVTKRTTRAQTRQSSTSSTSTSSSSRSRRASTAHSTQVSLQTVAAKKAEVNRLQFSVTKKSVGRVTGTVKKRKVR
ncbi:hst3 protein [Rhodotorula toruloides]|uniref:Hst3 protein n=1 Tax=Rhodotorula toruloides TaxID=5286 RepID=A0A511KQW5_RHOTO|nr:hst3 protein [Rhodotorula toruloides]